MRLPLTLILSTLLATSLVFGQEENFIFLDRSMYDDAAICDLVISNLDGVVLERVYLEPDGPNFENLDLQNYDRSSVVLTLLKAYPTENHQGHEYRYDCEIFPMPIQDTLSPDLRIFTPPLKNNWSPEFTVNFTGIETNGKPFVESEDDDYLRKVFQIAAPRGSKSFNIRTSPDYGYRLLTRTNEEGIYRECYLPTNNKRDQYVDCTQLPKTSGSLTIKTPKALKRIMIHAMDSLGNLSLLYAGTRESAFNEIKLIKPGGNRKIFCAYESVYGENRRDWVRYEAVYDQNQITLKNFSSLDAEYGRIGNKEVLDIHVELDSFDVQWYVSGEPIYFQQARFITPPDMGTSMTLRVNSDGELVSADGKVHTIPPLVAYTTRGCRYQTGKLFHPPPLLELLQDMGLSQEVNASLEANTVVYRLSHLHHSEVATYSFSARQ